MSDLLEDPMSDLASFLLEIDLIDISHGISFYELNRYT